MNYTYILRCRDGSFYTGWTNDLQRRLASHNEGKGSKYTRTRRPVELVYYEAFATKEDAMRREWQIKQMSRRQKEQLIPPLKRPSRADTIEARNQYDSAGGTECTTAKDKRKRKK